MIFSVIGGLLVPASEAQHSQKLIRIADSERENQTLAGRCSSDGNQLEVLIFDSRASGALRGSSGFPHKISFVPNVFILLGMQKIPFKLLTIKPIEAVGSNCFTIHLANR